MQRLTLDGANGLPQKPGRHESKLAERAELQPLLLSATDLAQLLRVSVPTIWRLRAAGKLPKPTAALGKQLVRWNRAEIERWLTAGMPDRETWEMIDHQEVRR